MIVIAWIVLNGIYISNETTGNYYKEDAFKSIQIGGGIGILMFLNVWGIIWPNQKKIIAATTATDAIVATVTLVKSPSTRVIRTDCIRARATLNAARTIELALKIFF